MRARRAALWIACSAYAIFWIGGIATRAGHLAPGPGWAAPLFLYLSASIVLLAADQWWPLLLFATAGFLFEVIGVRTGMPFGLYHYTPVLGPAVASVPLSISCAWLTLLAWARDGAWRATNSLPAAVLVGALLMTCADLLIDPVATLTLHFWQWQSRGVWFGVPLVNFAGWFGVSALLLMIAGKPPAPSRGAAFVGLATLGFFGLIAIVS